MTLQNQAVSIGISPTATIPELQQSKTGVLNTLASQHSRRSYEHAGINNLAPHDLRRTCAKLCGKSGGDLEQIKFLLGHSSIQTTERYLGSEQEIAVAVNDTLGL